MENALERLEVFVSNSDRSNNSDIQQLTPDASTREYFRINWDNAKAIACVYPEPFIPSEQSYLDVTNLFETSGLPVAEIYEFDSDLAIIIHEDFGDLILREVLESVSNQSKEVLINESIRFIALIQAATSKAFELNSIASRLKFDEEKLLWELTFFKRHYFEDLVKRPIEDSIATELNGEFQTLSRDLESRASVLCHRDYHAANLMVDFRGKLKIIDHQDARIGSVSYDLVSLLLDRVLIQPDQNWLTEKKEILLNDRKTLGLPVISLRDFNYEFDLMTVQRCLKAIGTFSNQTANCGKTNYVQYIQPMFRIVLEAGKRLNKFPVLQKVVENELNKS